MLLHRLLKKSPSFSFIRPDSVVIHVCGGRAVVARCVPAPMLSGVILARAENWEELEDEAIIACEIDFTTMDGVCFCPAELAERAEWPQG